MSATLSGLAFPSIALTPNAWSNRIMNCRQQPKVLVGEAFWGWGASLRRRSEVAQFENK